ncbi:MAG: DUF4340 domain-containing protein [Gammaproteobacteria bacterium]|nr:DUF4340 domain-containing protein [Gammaproteobacteria bacterium]
MKNRWLINLALVGIIAVLLLLVKLQPGKEAKPEYPVSQLKPGDIQRIELRQPGNDAMVFEIIDGNWRMTAPVNARANRFNISGLLKIAADKSGLRLALDGKSATGYGLGSTATRITFNRTEITIGHKHPLKEQRYVQTGDAVLLVSSNSLRMTENRYTDFLSTSLLEENHKLVALDLGEQKLQYQNGSWQLAPTDKNISADTINGFINEWRLAHALSVDRYSNKPVQRWINAVMKTDSGDAKPVTTRLGILGYEPEFVLYRPDEALEYRFAADIGNRLLTLKPAAKPEPGTPAKKAD